jgi:hypothetical protein
MTIPETSLAHVHVHDVMNTGILTTERRLMHLIVVDALSSMDVVAAYGGLSVAV